MNTEINATAVKVNTLFGINVQYKVPLYQRRYVWDISSWEVLWEDILDQEQLKSSENAKHFTGPIVTRLINGQQSRYEVIDGQQRLMTFQIIICVIRDLCQFFDFYRLKKEANKHLKNGDGTIRDFLSRDPQRILPDPTYKFRPSEYDKFAFDAIVNGEYGNEIKNVYDIDKDYLDKDKFEEVRSILFGEKTIGENIIEAYVYFYFKIRKQVQRNTKEETNKKVDNLLKIIKSNFELVQITPGDSQQAEEIYESVNATGRKLSEFDYLRNNLFLRAGEKSDDFYRKYWIFDNDPIYDWHTERLELFFQVFLMSKLGPDILNHNPKLFDIYQQHLIIPEQSVENEFEDIRNFADTFQKLDTDPKFGYRMQFYQDLSTYEEKESYNSYFASRYKQNITLVRSFILYLQHELEDPPDRNVLLKVLELLESYIARRLLVDTVAGRFAFDAIRTYFRDIYNSENKVTFSIDNMVIYLVRVGKRRWISNAIVENWFEDNEHQKHLGWSAQALEFTERYIFYRIENWKREKVKETPLSFAKEEFPPYRMRVQKLNKLNDEVAWVSLGNLTFCWGGDVRMRNADFDQERSFLQNHGNNSLILNREICDTENWSTSKIQNRKEDLISIFHEIWKSEDNFLSNIISWNGLETKYPAGSVTLGRVVNIGKFGAILQLEEGVEGVIRNNEFAWIPRRNIDPSEIVNEGELIRVKILDISEEKRTLSLSRKQALPNPWTGVTEKYKIGTVVRGKIYNITDTGAFAELEEGITGLIHKSELANRKVERPEEIVSVGEELELKVISLNEKEMRIRLSLKAVRFDPWIKVSERYNVGSVVRCEIVRLTDFGAFAELEPGIDGLIRISELAHRRVNKPEEIVSIGEELDLKVIGLDPATRRMALSLKAVTHDPWVKAPEKYKVGSVVQGKIYNIVDYGAFAELEGGITGLIPIAEMAERKVEKPEEVVSVGEELDLKVIELDPTRRRITLSMKGVAK